ncbi:MAG: hypothetical protein KC619_06010 [Myxococcales bacterium]|nr:hypothetical protein [Myxococcales bacterium]
MNDETFYDLSRASAISARLVRLAARPPEPPPAPAPPASYVRFPRTQRGSAGGPPSTDLRERDLDEVEWSSAMMGSGGWTALLEWCVSAVDGDGAFIVDAGGLVVAIGGNLPTDVMEETGARLSFAFEQGDRMLGGPATVRSIGIELERGWLVGVQVRTVEGMALIVGVVSPSPLSAAARDTLVRVFSKKALGV